MNIENYISQIVKNAKEASRVIASASTAVKNTALHHITEGIIASATLLKAENEKDIIAAHKAGLPEPMIDRLRLTDSRISGMAEGVRQIIHLADPIGEVIRGYTQIGRAHV